MTQQTIFGAINDFSSHLSRAFPLFHPSQTDVSTITCNSTYSPDLRKPALGEEYNVSDRAIRDIGRFYEAVERLEGSIQAKGRILHESLPLSRSEIIWLSEQPDEDHRDLWARALPRKDLQELMKTRAKTQPRPLAAFSARPAP